MEISTHSCWLLKVSCYFDKGTLYTLFEYFEPRIPVEFTCQCVSVHIHCVKFTSMCIINADYIIHMDKSTLRSAYRSGRILKNARQVVFQSPSCTKPECISSHVLILPIMSLATIFMKRDADDPVKSFERYDSRNIAINIIQVLVTYNLNQLISICMYSNLLAEP